MSFRCIVICTKMKSISVQTQPNSICYVELHVSTYIWSSSASQLVFKIYWGRNTRYV